MPITDWTAAPPQPSLSGNQIHVWRVDISPPAGATYNQLLAVLTDKERERANRFLAEKHRGRYVVGRASMRQILGHYTKQPPNEVELQFENLGKPFFADKELNAKFQFNFSNSSNLAICAITLDQPLGVDLERIRSMSDMLGLAKRYFANSETEELFALPTTAQPAAFFRLWTRKEAWLKAIGKGLTVPLRDVEVSIDDENCHIRTINQCQVTAAAWDLIPFTPADEHIGAIAIKRKNNQPAFYDFTL